MRLKEKTAIVTGGANGIGRDVANSRRFCEEFQDRILFGRDYFDRAQLDALDTLSLPATVLDKILRHNALRLIRA